MKNVRLVAMAGLLGLTVFSVNPVHGQITCTVIEHIPCPPVDTVQCENLIFGHCDENDNCDGSSELNDFGGNVYDGTYEAATGQAGFFTINTIGSVFCSRERACGEKCETIDLGLIIIKRCKKDESAEWINTGTEYSALAGQDACVGQNPD